MATELPNWQRLVLGVAAVVGVAFGACKTGDDSVCEIICNCEDGIQFVGANYCDRESLRCASGAEECASLCEDNGGLKHLCSFVDDQPVGHVGPEAVCPGIDPVGEDCDPRPNCAVAPRGFGQPAWLLVVILAASRRRRTH